MSDTNVKYIYIVVSKTDTALGRLIQKKLHVKYNHCSLSLDESLNTIYSFGRKELKNMFRAGFVLESKNYGFFKKYSNSHIAVLKIPVTYMQWQRILNNIKHFQKHKKTYKYSALGLVYCYLGRDTKRNNKYFCSQFVTEVLEISGVCLFNKPQTLVRPHDFLSLSSGKIVYTGQIGNYLAVGGDA